MKPTKKPKRVRVDWHPVVERYSAYTCPTCNVTFKGAGVGRKTTRFKCDCGQELTVFGHAEFPVNPELEQKAKDASKMRKALVAINNLCDQDGSEFADRVFALCKDY